MSDSLSVTDQRDSLFSRAVPGLLAGAAAVGIAVLNPTDSGVTICASQRLFGIDCPFCGGLRCVNSLMRGDFAAAADHNVVLAIGLPIVAITWVAWFVAQATGRDIKISEPPNWVIGIVAVFMVAFTVIRNVNGPAWVTWLGSGLYH